MELLAGVIVEGRVVPLPLVVDRYVDALWFRVGVDRIAALERPMPGWVVAWNCMATQ